MFFKIFDFFLNIFSSSSFPQFQSVTRPRTFTFQSFSLTVASRVNQRACCFVFVFFSLSVYFIWLFFSCFGGGSSVSLLNSALRSSCQCSSSPSDLCSHKRCFCLTSTHSLVKWILFRIKLSLNSKKLQVNDFIFCYQSKS